MDKENIGRLLLRIGLGIVFIWFGIDKFLRPELWEGWIPILIQSILQSKVLTFLYFLGVFEVIIGVLVLVGFYTRVAAGIAALFLFAVVLSSFSGEILVRDIGLIFLALGIVVLGSEKYSVGYSKRQKL